jgi:hypothetical protein
MRLERSGRQRVSRGEIFVDLLPELTLLELGDPDPPISLVIAALAFGATEAAKSGLSEAVKDAYSKLQTKARFDPKAWECP